MSQSELDKKIPRTLFCPINLDPLKTITGLDLQFSTTFLDLVSWMVIPAGLCCFPTCRKKAAITVDLSLTESLECAFYEMLPDVRL